MSDNLFSINNFQINNLKDNQLKYLSEKFEKIFLEVKRDIKNDKKTLNILDNKFKLNFRTNDLKKFKKFKTIVIIGMGGSILGAEAIYNFLDIKIKKKVYFFNDIDENKISNFKKKENLSKVLFVIISKSGNTVETLSNLFTLNIIKKNAKNIILISEKKNNLLFSLSKKFNLFHIQHKDYIGGRYSVLSEVGAVPALLMGINISKLRSNILDTMKGRNKITLKNSTIKLASILNSKKLNNLVFLNYSPELEKFMFWCQQLIAESLGKNGKGFFPVISSVPKDHHSLLQLYLDGPKDKLFNIFSIEKKTKERVHINKKTGINSFLNKKNLASVKNAQRQALIKAFNKKNIPLREFKIKKLNEKVLGKLFSYFILENVITAKLSNLNPFNQPAVEQVKIYTKKLLT